MPELSREVFYFLSPMNLGKTTLKFHTPLLSCFWAGLERLVLQEVRTVKVADRSGMVNLSLWNEPGKVLQSGDIIRMTRGYTGMLKNCLTIYTTK